MKPEFQAKFLQYLNSTRKEDEGFTLIELLVVIIIIGILAAIALPSLLGQANKARQSEARNNVGAIMRGQQAAFLESQTFNTDMVQLGLGLKTQTVNYKYEMLGNNANGFTTVLRIYARPLKGTLKAYVGTVATDLVGAAGTNNAGEATTQATLCESVKAATNALEPTNIAAPTSLGSAALSCTDLNNLQVGGAGSWKDLGS